MQQHVHAGLFGEVPDDFLHDYLELGGGVEGVQVGGAEEVSEASSRGGVGGAVLGSRSGGGGGIPFVHLAGFRRGAAGFAGGGFAGTGFSGTGVSSGGDGGRLRSMGLSVSLRGPALDQQGVLVEVWGADLTVSEAEILIAHLAVGVAEELPLSDAFGQGPFEHALVQQAGHIVVGGAVLPDLPGGHLDRAVLEIALL